MRSPRMRAHLGMISLFAVALPLLHGAAWGETSATEKAATEKPAPSADKPKASACDRHAFRAVIDVGHTLTVGGATSARGIYEYEFNLRLAKQVAKKLTDAGFDKTVLLIPLPSGQPAPLVQAEGERGRPISQIRLDILTVLREAGKPLTTTRLLEAMALRKPPMEWSERSVSEHLARMVEDGTLENPDGARPRSYRFPQGEQPPA